MSMEFFEKKRKKERNTHKQNYKISRLKRKLSLEEDYST